MNRNQHLVTGLLAFIFYAIILYWIRPFQMDAIAYGGIAAIIGSNLPDFVELPTSWMHRSFGHSRRVLRGSLLLLLLFTIFSFFYPYALIVSGASLGYATHLILDSTTPVGLPD